LIRTPWVRLVVVAALGLLLGYALGQMQGSDVTCLYCGDPVPPPRRARICAKCLPEYTKETMDEGRAWLLRDRGEAERMRDALATR